MSLPPVDYSVPPPRLDMPPPASSSGTRIPPPQMYSHPPPFIPPPLSEQSPSYVPMATFPAMNLPPPPVNFSKPLSDIQSVPPPYSVNQSPYYLSQSYIASRSTAMSNSAGHSRDWQNPPRISLSAGKNKASASQGEKDRIPRESMDRHYYDSSAKPSSSRDRHYDRDRMRDRDRDMRYRDRRRSRSRSPSRHRRRSRSPSHSHRERDKERYYRDRYDERRDYERRRSEYERRYSPSRSRDIRSHSRSYDSRDDRRRFRSPSRRSQRSPTRESHRRSRTREMSVQIKQEPREATPSKPMTDREKILEEYR